MDALPIMGIIDMSDGIDIDRLYIIPINL
jgi:hypothetical protein